MGSKSEDERRCNRTPPLNPTRFFDNVEREWLFIFLICVRSEDRLTTMCRCKLCIWWGIKGDTAETTTLRIAKAGRSWITKARRDIAHKPQLLTLFQSLSTKKTINIIMFIIIIIQILLV